jgi:hypothetical protein
LYFIVNGVAEVNHPPILLPIGNKTIDEGKLLKVSLASTDQDQFGESIYTLTGLPEHSVFDGKNFYWTPGFDQSGTYSIVFTATDAGNTALSAQIDSETIVVTVNNANPILNRLEQLAKNIQSNQPLSITSGARQILSCSDLSGQIEKLTLSMLRWDNTTFGQFQASFVGGVGPDRLSDVITIAASPSRTQNDIMFTFDPAIDVDSDLCANGGSVEFRVKSLNNSISYLYGTNNVDAYPNGRATLYPGAASYTPLDLYFIVNEHANTNQSPTIINLSTQSIMEDNNFTFTLQATDPDNDPLVYSGSNLPTGATLNPATGEFSWTPNYNDAGTYVVEFSVSDGDLSATTSTTIEVLNTNRAPVLESIGNQTTSENQTLSFTVNASDEDNDTVTYSATNLPPGATFNQLTRTFSWTPAFNQSGNYENIEFTVTDNSSPMELDVELITITVGDVNRAPVFISPGTQEVLENNQLQFTVSASDPDNDTATVSATNLPSGATFNATTLQFSWIPTLAQEGIYTVTFIATDNGIPIETSAIDVVITVGDNPTPVEQAEDIIDTVTTFNLPNNVENSYMANLQKVGTFIEAGNTQATISQLTAFINKVNQDYNQNKITLQVKNTLVSLAEGLIGDLE